MNVWIDWAIAVGVFLAFLSMSYQMVADRATSQQDIQEIFSVKSSVLDYFDTIFGSQGSPSDWTSGNFDEIGLVRPLYKIPISVNETSGLEREQEAVDLHVVFDDGCDEIAREKTVRLYHENKEIAFDLYNKRYCSSGFLEEADLVFFPNVSAGSSQFYYLYFSGDQKVRNTTNYTSSLTYGDYLENGKLRTNLTGEVSELYNLETGSGDLLDGRNLGVVQYNSTTGNLEQTNVSSEGTSLPVDSKFKKVVEISGSTNWYQYKLNVTLYAHQSWLKVRTQVDQTQDVTVHDFKNPEAALYSGFEKVAYGNQTGNYSSTDSSKNIGNATWIAPLNSTGVDSLSLLTTNSSPWKQGGWNKSGREISLSHIYPEYDTQSKDLTSGDTFSGEFYIYLFKSGSRDQVANFYQKISKPLNAKVLPKKEIMALSPQKLKELKEVAYSEAAKSLGDYEFKIKIEK